MKQIILIVILSTLALSINGQDDSSNALYNIEIIQRCMHEDLAVFFVLIRERSDKKWELMSDASKMITSTVFDEFDDIKNVVVMYYNDERFMPTASSKSKQHLSSIITRSLAARVLETRLIGYTEATRATSEVIRYPVVTLQIMNRQGAFDNN